MSKILLIDNYDSFTYNLYHYLDELANNGVEVMRNDEIDFDRINQFHEVVISPGPGLPKEAGDLMVFLERYVQKKKILGICLGLQAISEHFGMPLKNLEQVVHGQATPIEVLDQSSVFKGLPSHFKVGRYHSWVMDESDINSDFSVTAIDKQGHVMGIRHQHLPIEAVQFHPESILTEFGKEMLNNWLIA